MAEIMGIGTEALVSIIVSTTVGEKKKKKRSLNHMAPLRILTSCLDTV